MSNGSFANKSDDILALIETDAAKFSADGSQIFACGDFNARTNKDPDYLDSDVNEKNDNILNLPMFIPNCESNHRNNTDLHTTDERGKNLLQFCKTTGLSIINGRFLGDTAGNFTCYSHSGAPSTIDYMLTTAPLCEKIRYFQVNDLSIHSIHCSLSVSLSMGNFSQFSNIENDQLLKSKKFIWTHGDNEEFQNVISSSYFQQCIGTLMEDNCNSENIDTFSKNLTEIICNAASTAKIKLKTRKSSIGHSAKITKRKSKPWFNGKCKSLKNDYQKLVKEIKRDPFNRQHRFEINRQRKIYKATIKKSKVDLEKKYMVTARNI